MDITQHGHGRVKPATASGVVKKLRVLCFGDYTVYVHRAVRPISIDTIAHHRLWAFI